jgi:hypothetical protein
MISADVLDELVTLRADARLAAESFTLAIAEQSEKAEISKSALRRYVCAKEAGKLDTLNGEAEDLASLLENAE